MECNGINFWKNHYGCLNPSTIEETSLGGAEVKEETIKETETFNNLNPTENNISVNLIDYITSVILKEYQNSNIQG